MDKFLNLIKEERQMQDKKWWNPHFSSNYSGVAVLTEEVGEVARVVLEKDTDNLKGELIQVAAVCVKFL